MAESTSERGYQGWANFETWCLALWIDNDESSHAYWRERAREAWAEAEQGGNRFVDDRESRAALLLAGWLKAEVEEASPELGGFYGDVLNAAIAEVDWHEIATGWIANTSEDGEPHSADS